MIMRIPILIAFLFLALVSHAQLSITGRVTVATDNQPAIGVTVMVQGTSTGTVTDFDGNYAITVPDRNAVLVFSYTGYASQDLVVGDRASIDVALEESVSLLNEVVVTGYGSQKRSNISGSVSTVNAEEIAERPITRVEQALQGRVAGVQVAQVSGSPGSAQTVRIRGVGTINNSDPLYIVDGIPVDGLDFLNPNDIETMNVLKDAASAAIYGSRAAAGDDGDGQYHP